MHGTDAAGFQEALINLALSRGTLGDRNDAPYMRGRIAFLIWMPGFLLVLMLAVAARSETIVVVGVAALVLILWRFMRSAKPVPVRGGEDPTP